MMNHLKSIYNSPFKDSHSHPMHTYLPIIASNASGKFWKLLILTGCLCEQKHFFVIHLFVRKCYYILLLLIYVIFFYGRKDISFLLWKE